MNNLLFCFLHNYVFVKKQMIIQIQKNVKKKNNLQKSEIIINLENGKNSKKRENSENQKTPKNPNFNPDFIRDKMLKIKELGFFCILISKNSRFNNKITAQQTESYFVEELKYLKKPIFCDYFILYHSLLHFENFENLEKMDFSLKKKIEENIFVVKKIIERDFSLGREKFIVNYSQRNCEGNFLMTYAQVEKETFLVFFRGFEDLREYRKLYFRSFQICQREFSPILNYLKFDLISDKTGI